MPDYYFMRVIKEIDSHKKKKIDRLMRQDYGARIGDIRVPQTEISVYKSSDQSEETLARILLEHGAEIPLESPVKNTSLLDISQFIDAPGRRMIPAPETRIFSFCGSRHCNFHVADLEDLRVFITDVSNNFSRLEKPVKLETMQQYLAGRVAARDGEWTNLVNTKTLDPTWFSFTPAPHSLTSLKNLVPVAVNATQP